MKYFERYTVVKHNKVNTFTFKFNVQKWRAPLLQRLYKANAPVPVSKILILTQVLRHW